MELLGIFAGHVYFFFKYSYPARSGVNLLETPTFLCVFLFAGILVPDLSINFLC